MAVSLAKRLTYGFFAIIGLGVVGEIGVRAEELVRFGTPFLASPDITDLISRDSTGAHGTPNGQFKDVRLNSAGFRSSEEALTRKPGCTRVMALGASETLGTGAGAQGNEYPAQLEDSLSAVGCYQVLNTGMQGVGLRTMLHFWNHWASRFQPDIVVVLITPTMYLVDPVAPYLPDETRPHPRPPFRPASRLAALVHEHTLFPDFILWQRVQNQLAGLIGDVPPSWYFSTVPKDRLEMYRHDLDSLLTLIQLSGAKPVLGTYAMRFGRTLLPSDSLLMGQWRVYAPKALPNVMLDFTWDARDVVIALGRQRGIPIVDLGLALNGREELFDDWAHFTGTGAKIVAGLVKQGVVEAAGRPAGVAHRH
jgi:hypothetical protein